jgi:UDP-3-O-[3-hydroxymyristoyl] glucosamine N-acyltransferase
MESWLRRAFYCPTVIHTTAFIEDSATLGDGIQVFPLAYVGIRVQVGYGCIINTGAIVSHDCIPGAIC